MIMNNRMPMIIATIIAISCMLYASPVKADSDTEMTVIVITDGNVNASFDAEAGGDVNYWIDGIEVKGEFNNIWDAIDNVKTEAESASNSALVAYLYANSNFYKLLVVEDDVSVLNDSLADNASKIKQNEDDILYVYYKTVSNNDSICTLFSEMGAFEQEYLAFKQESLDQIAALNADFEEFKALVTNVGIITGMGLVVVGLFFMNRRYPFKDVVKNGKKMFKDDKKRKTIDASGKAKKAKAKKASSRTIGYKIFHIRRNKEKSPLKYLMTFFHLSK